MRRTESKFQSSKSYLKYWRVWIGKHSEASLSSIKFTFAFFQAQQLNLVHYANPNPRPHLAFLISSLFFPSSPSLQCLSTVAPRVCSFSEFLPLSLGSLLRSPPQWHAIVLPNKVASSHNSMQRKCLGSRLIHADSHGLKCHGFSLRSRHWRAGETQRAAPAAVSGSVSVTSQYFHANDDELN